jgi:predicted metal-dependent hydrolase
LLRTAYLSYILGVRYGKIEIEYVKRKTFLIKVMPCSTVKVLAPKKSSPLLIEALLEKRKDWIAKKRHYFTNCKILKRPPNIAAEQVIREEAIKIFTDRLNIYLPLLNGLHNKSVTLCQRFMRRQWGSCSNKGRICLNTHLIETPLECIDFVIVHELCHLAILNHSPKYYSLLNKLMPDWKRKETELRNYHCV